IEKNYFSFFRQSKTTYLRTFFPIPDSELIFLVCGVQMYTLFPIPQDFFKENIESFFNQS
ncbi:hypothetical protein PXD56_13525, partial [Maribacter sp. SA7]|uniref:hypothetical protein n=1 Tax=Maribacter zhoushanensis TaxID=3030012 RepID=UPI0023EB0423